MAKWTEAPEAHPLDSARGKNARALQQAEFLSRHCEAYAASEPLRPVANFDAESGTHLLYIEGRKPPLYLGLILGEIVHDLRSALDHVAWQLALEHSGSDVLSDYRRAREVQFPIASAREVFENHRALKYFSAEAIARMEPLQPYNNVGTHLVNPLAQLQGLSNTDKHQALTPSLAQIRSDDIRLQSDEPITADDFEMVQPDGTIVDETMPIYRIHASRNARFRFFPLPAQVCFRTEIRGVPDVIFVDQIRDQLWSLTVDAVEVFADMFPRVDYSERLNSWKTPRLAGE